MRNWSKLRGLSAREKRLLVTSLIALPVNAVGLTLLGLNRWQALLSRLAPIDHAGVKADAKSLLEQAQQTARVVCIASSRGPYRGKCCSDLLRFGGCFASEDRERDSFGARREGGKIEAHAWVEFRGSR